MAKIHNQRRDSRHPEPGVILIYTVIGLLLVTGIVVAGSMRDVSQGQALLSADDASPRTPDGCEVKACGGVGSRTVWLHLAVEFPTRQGNCSGFPTGTPVLHARNF